MGDAETQRRLDQLRQADEDCAAAEHALARARAGITEEIAALQAELLEGAVSGRRGAPEERRLWRRGP